MNYYNENDAKAASWLRQLIAAHLIPEGTVDERSINEVEACDLEGFTQCHFFAGIGGWSYALRLAGWPDTRAIWTGSCPCQPFSIAGQKKGVEDDRHLWPAFRGLIAKRNPSTCLGEQVASPDGRLWLAGIRADLEAMGYAVGAADLCAAGVSSPQPRQRLYWVANADNSRSQGRRRSELRQRSGECVTRTGRHASPERLVCANGGGRTEGRQGAAGHGYGHPIESAGGNGSGGLERSESNGRKQRRAESIGRELVGGCGWDSYDVLPFRDGKLRRVEAGTFPVAHGIPDRVGLLRGYGNAIVPQLAAEFIKAACHA